MNLGEESIVGIFKSDKLKYYVFRDYDTLNNLVGFTFDRKRFSIYLYDDKRDKAFLRISQKLKFETDWVERLNISLT